VRIDVRPALPAEEQAALERALATAGVDLDATPEPYRSAWRRAAAHEAVDGEPDADGYALLPRSTRGATRA
jgi:hypothetical protein